MISLADSGACPCVSDANSRNVPTTTVIANQRSDARQENLEPCIAPRDRLRIEQRELVRVAIDSSGPQSLNYCFAARRHSVYFVNTDCSMPSLMELVIFFRTLPSRVMKNAAQSLFSPIQACFVAWSPRRIGYAASYFALHC